MQGLYEPSLLMPVLVMASLYYFVDSNSLYHAITFLISSRFTASLLIADFTLCTSHSVQLKTAHGFHFNYKK